MLADEQVAIVHRRHPARLRSALGHSSWRKDHEYWADSALGNGRLLTILEIRRTVKSFGSLGTALHAALRLFAPSSHRTARAFSSRKHGLKSGHESPNSLDRPSQESQYWSPSTQAPNLSLRRSHVGVSLEVPKVSVGQDEAAILDWGEIACVD